MLVNRALHCNRIRAVTTAKIFDNLFKFKKAIDLQNLYRYQK